MLIHSAPDRRAGHKWEYWNLRISIANTDKRIIDWFTDRFAGGFVTHARSTDPKCRDVFSWRITSKKAQPVLIAVMPYLMLKREQAELAMQFIATHRLVGCRGHSIQMIEQRRAWAAQMKALNSRGKETPRWPVQNWEVESASRLLSAAQLPLALETPQQ